MSTTTRPVTHTADVAVNSAVTGLVHSPDVADGGSISRPVPIAMRTRNPSARTSAGWRGGRRMARATLMRIANGAVRCTRTRRSPGRLPLPYRHRRSLAAGTGVRGRGVGRHPGPDRPASPRPGPGWLRALVRTATRREPLHALQTLQLAAIEPRRPQTFPGARRYRDRPPRRPAPRRHRGSLPSPGRASRPFESRLAHFHVASVIGSSSGVDRLCGPAQGPPADGVGSAVHRCPVHRPMVSGGERRAGGAAGCGLRHGPPGFDMRNGPPAAAGGPWRVPGRGAAPRRLSLPPRRLDLLELALDGLVAGMSKGPASGPGASPPSSGAAPSASDADAW